MPSPYKTPDVYVEEISVFPPSVAEVATAIPAFVGYTEKATRSKKDDLLLVPTKIYSLKDYEQLFGNPFADPITVVLTTNKATGGFDASITEEPTVAKTSYLLYHAVKMFFDNGGAQAYVCSVGNYTASIDDTALKKGLDAVAQEDEPTLLVVPEAVKLTYAAYKGLSQTALDQCGQLQDRFAILDTWGGASTPTTVASSLDAAAPSEDIITANRDAYGTNLKYGASYYPFVRTTLNPYVSPTDDSTVSVEIDGNAAVKLGSLITGSTPNTAAYNAAKAELKNHFLVMPPSGAVAGVFAATDAARGVWKAPANVALADVLEPVVKLTNLQQETLNVDASTGKSVNALRAFAGKGTLVWGARTLAGNDNEWRYVSVRRFFTMVEESIKKSTSWAVFEPNDANTWVKVRGMISNYLTDKWRDGALAGAKPDDAFFVKCGIGVTMSSQDILEGRMNVEIGMAAVRPAEFIILKFSHKLQTS